MRGFAGGLLFLRRRLACRRGSFQRVFDGLEPCKLRLALDLAYSAQFAWHCSKDKTEVLLYGVEASDRFARYRLKIGQASVKLLDLVG